jgi:arsenate reductase
MKPKKVMNLQCIKCHKAEKRAGKPHGPVTCTTCHAKGQWAPDQSTQRRFNHAYILGLQGSPRKGGNTDTFLAAFHGKSRPGGCRTKPSRWPGPASFPAKAADTAKPTAPASLPTIPCPCEIFGLLRTADLVVAASPVYFYGITAQLKVLIDRCQTLWSRKYVYQLKDPAGIHPKRTAVQRGRIQGTPAVRRHPPDGEILFRRHRRPVRSCADLPGRRSQRRHTASMQRPDHGYRRGRRRNRPPLVARKRVLFVSRPTGPAGRPWRRPWPSSATENRIRTGYGCLRPASEFSTTMVQTMQRVGVDMGYRRPQHVDQAFYGATPDLTIIIGDGADRTMVPGTTTKQWPLTKPVSSDDETMDRLRMEIDAHVDTLKPSFP